MGYTTDFSGGGFLITPAPTEKMIEFINKFNETRRVGRNQPEKYGVQGEFFVDGTDSFGQDNTPDIINGNRPTTQPGYWCQWRIEHDDTLTWDGVEKFYEYVDWLVYLIEKVFKPNGYTLNGDLTWSGEDPEDVGKIIVTDNVVETMEAFSMEREEHKPSKNMRTDVVYIIDETADVSDVSFEEVEKKVKTSYSKEEVEGLMRRSFFEGQLFGRNEILKQKGDIYSFSRADNFSDCIDSVLEENNIT